MFIHLVWIFAGDTSCNHVTPGRGCSRQPLEVNGGVSPWLDAVQHTDVFDSLERNPHGNLAWREGQQLNTRFDLCCLFNRLLVTMFQTLHHI